jgi:type IV secretion system protein VirB6
MISPIGSFITQFDTAITAGMASGITGLTAYMTTPVKTSAALWCLVYGVRVANGDAAVQPFVLRVVRMVIVLWICSNSATYNQYVTDFFYTGLPAALNKAVLANQLGAGGGANLAGGVQGTGAIFDNLWAQSDVLVGNILQQAPLLDVGSRAAAYIYGACGGLILVVIAMVYMMARFILAIVLELGVLAIACLIFDATTPIFERWLGKVIALVFLQVTAIVVLQIVLDIDQVFIKQIVAGGGGVPDKVQALMAMVVLFFMGAFAVYSLPAIAYSIGTGVAIQTMAPLMMAARGVMGMAAVTAAADIAQSADKVAEATEGLSMGLASAPEIGGGSSGGLIAPDPGSLPPPPLSLPGQ